MPGSEFASGIDRRDESDIGIVEAGGEFVEQGLQPRVAVRLDHGDDASIAGDAGGAEHSGDLDRMMRVVVIDAHALPFADMGEAALHAGEAGKASTDGVVAHACLGRNGERRKRIQRM